jgi:hypothetical protein
MHKNVMLRQCRSPNAFTYDGLADSEWQPLGRKHHSAGSEGVRDSPQGILALLQWLSTRAAITILRYRPLLSDYARTLANRDGTAMLINKRRFFSIL